MGRVSQSRQRCSPGLPDQLMKLSASGGRLVEKWCILSAAARSPQLVRRHESGLGSTKR